MLKITYKIYSDLLKQEFVNTRIHRTMSDFNLLCMSLNWHPEILNVEEV